MADEAPLADTGAGLVPQGEAGSSSTHATRLLRHDAFGARVSRQTGVSFRSNRSCTSNNTHSSGSGSTCSSPAAEHDVPPRVRPEDFLVLSGECLLIVEGGAPPARLDPSTAAEHDALVRGRGRAMRAAHGRRPRDEGTILYPRTRRRSGGGRGRARDALAAGGIRAVSALAPRAARALGPSAHFARRRYRGQQREACPSDPLTR